MVRASPEGLTGESVAIWRGGRAGAGHCLSLMNSCTWAKLRRQRCLAPDFARRRSPNTVLNCWDRQETKLKSLLIHETQPVHLLLLPRWFDPVGGAQTPTSWPRSNPGPRNPSHNSINPGLSARLAWLRG